MDGPMGPYLKAGRFIPLAIDPFIDVRTMLFDGMQAEFRRLQEDQDEKYVALCSSSCLLLMIYEVRRTRKPRRKNSSGSATLEPTTSSRRSLLVLVTR
jgi:hypothetical protein